MVGTQLKLIFEEYLKATVRHMKMIMEGELGRGL